MECVTSSFKVKERPRLPGTGRLEAYSDGVFAIVATLLVLELKVPHLEVVTPEGLWLAVRTLWPKFFSFAVSFFVVTIFWVNHHHFCHRITHSDWKLMWLNSLLLFWLTVLPFTTAFLGDYPDQPLVIGLYAMTLCLASLSFTAMGHYVFFKSELLEPWISQAHRVKEWRRSMFAALAFGLTALVAAVSVPTALVALGLLPLFYVIPGALQQSPPFGTDGWEGESMAGATAE